MRSVRDPSGVVIGGLFGTGKSSVAEEIATSLERDGLPYGALDLDWLGWFETGSEENHERVWLDNVLGVVTNYLGAGVRHFVMAGTFWRQEEVDVFRAALPFPLTFVELRVPWAEIERRLRSSPSPAGWTTFARCGRGSTPAGSCRPPTSRSLPIARSARSRQRSSVRSVGRRDPPRRAGRGRG